MPQMAPMNWLLLFFIFIAVFMLTSINSYFSLTYKPSIYKPIKSFKINWKW